MEKLTQLLIQLILNLLDLIRQLLPKRMRTEVRFFFLGLFTGMLFATPSVIVLIAQALILVARR